MSWLSALFQSTSGSIIKEIGETFDSYHLSGEEKQDFELKIRRSMVNYEIAIEESIRKNIEAKERILVAELQQGDSYTKRARPTVVYFGLLMIALNYFVVPLISMWSSSEIIYFDLPTEFWFAWGGIVSTWAVGRSFEKVGIKNKATRMLTGSRLLDEPMG